MIPTLIYYLWFFLTGSMQELYEKAHHHVRDFVFRRMVSGTTGFKEFT